MDVTIIGTANVARGIGERAEEVAGDLGGEVSTALSGDQLEGDVFFLAFYYPDAREAFEQYRDQLSGKTVVDSRIP